LFGKYKEISYELKVQCGVRRAESEGRVAKSPFRSFALFLRSVFEL